MDLFVSVIASAVVDDANSHRCEGEGKVPQLMLLLALGVLLFVALSSLSSLLSSSCCRCCMFIYCFCHSIIIRLVQEKTTRW